MRKIIKIIVIILLTIAILYALFITEESFRLKKDGEYPLIILNNGYCNKNGKVKNTQAGYEIKCNGLGYSIIREYSPKEESSDVYFEIKAEFWLFDKYLLWGWII